MNLYGKRGSPQHRKEIARIADEIEYRGFRAILEKLFFTPEGKKKRRFADVVALDDGANISEIHQVGLSDLSGRPIKREREAISDIESSADANNLKVKFHTYHKLIILVVFFETFYF